MGNSMAKLGIEDLLTIVQTDEGNDRLQALERLEVLALHENSHEILLDEGCVELLLQVMETEDAEAADLSMRVLANFGSAGDDDIKEYLALKCSSLLCTLASSELPMYQRSAARALASIATSDDSKMIVAKRGGAKVLVALITSKLPEVQLECLRGIANLAENYEAVDLLVKEGGVVPLVGFVLSTQMYGLARYHAIRAMANLSISPIAREKLIASGALDSLKVARDSGDPTLSLLIAQIFTSFSEIATALAGEEKENADKKQDAGYKSARQDAGSISTLYNLTKSDRRNFALDAIWGLANYAEDRTKRKEIIETGGIPIICTLLIGSDDLQIQFEASRAILAMSEGGESCLQALLEHNIVPVLVETLLIMSKDPKLYADLYAYLNDLHPYRPIAPDDEEAKKKAKKKRRIRNAEGLNLKGKEKDDQKNVKIGKSGRPIAKEGHGPKVSRTAHSPEPQPLEKDGSASRLQPSASRRDLLGIGPDQDVCIIDGKLIRIRPAPVEVPPSTSLPRRIIPKKKKKHYTSGGDLIDEDDADYVDTDGESEDEDAQFLNNPEMITAAAKEMICINAAKTIALLAKYPSAATQSVQLGAHVFIMDLCESDAIEAQLQGLITLGNLAEMDPCVEALGEQDAIPLFIDMLYNGVPAVQTQAARALANMGRENGPNQKIIYNLKGTYVLRRLLNTTDLVLLPQLLRALAFSSGIVSVKAYIVETEMIRFVVQYTYSVNLDVKYYSTVVLNNIADYEMFHVKMAAEGALRPLVSILRNPTSTTRDIASAASCIAKLTSKYDGNRQMMLSVDGIKPTLSMLKYRPSDSGDIDVSQLQSQANDVLFYSLQIIANMSTLEEIRVEVAKSDAVLEINNYIFGDNFTVVRESLRALANLSLNETLSTIINRICSLGKLMDLSRHRNSGVAASATQLLVNLAKNEKNRSRMIDNKVLEVVFTKAKIPSTRMQTQATTGIKYFAEDEKGRTEMVKLGIFDILGDLIKDSMVTPLKRAQHGLAYPELNLAASGPMLEGIVINGKLNRFMIKLAVESEKKNEALQTNIVEALLELAKIDEFKPKIVNGGTFHFVVLMTRSRDTALRTLATILIARLAERKDLRIRLLHPSFFLFRTLMAAANTANSQLVELSAQYEKLMSEIKVSDNNKAMLEQRLVEREQQMKQKGRVELEEAELKRQESEQPRKLEKFKSKSKIKAEEDPSKAVKYEVAAAPVKRDPIVVLAPEERQRRVNRCASIVSEWVLWIEFTARNFFTLFNQLEKPDTRKSIIQGYGFEPFMLAGANLTALPPDRDTFDARLWSFRISMRLAVDSGPKTKLFMQNSGVRFLFQCIARPEFDLQEDALGILAEVSLSDNYKMSISMTGDLKRVMSLVEASSTPNIPTHAMRLLANLFSNDLARLKLLDNGFVDFAFQVVRATDKYSPETLFHALRVVGILVNQAEFESLLGASIEAICHVATLTDIRLLRMCIKILTSLAAKEPIRPLMLEHGGAQALVHHLDPSKYLDVTTDALKGLQSISVRDAEREAVASEELGTRLLRLLQTKDAKLGTMTFEGSGAEVIRMALKVLGNVSSIDIVRDVVAVHGLPDVIEFLYTTNTENLWEAVRIFSNLAKKGANAVPICQNKGLQALQHIVTTSENVEILRMCARTLANLASQVSAHPYLAKRFVLSTIFKLTELKSSSDILLQMAQSLRFLTEHEEFKTFLFETDYFGLIISFSEFGSEAIRVCALQIIANTLRGQVVDGKIIAAAHSILPKMMQIMTTSPFESVKKSVIFVIKAFSLHDVSSQAIVDLNLLPVLMQMFNTEEESIQEEVGHALENMSCKFQHLLPMSRKGGLDTIFKMSKRPNESISHSGVRILSNMSPIDSIREKIYSRHGVEMFWALVCQITPHLQSIGLFGLNNFLLPDVHHSSSAEIPVTPFSSSGPLLASSSSSQRPSSALSFTSSTRGSQDLMRGSTHLDRLAEVTRVVKFDRLISLARSDAPAVQYESVRMMVYTVSEHAVRSALLRAGGLQTLKAVADMTPHVIIRWFAHSCISYLLDADPLEPSNAIEKIHTLVEYSLHRDERKRLYSLRALCWQSSLGDREILAEIVNTPDALNSLVSHARSANRSLQLLALRTLEFIAAGHEFHGKILKEPLQSILKLARSDDENNYLAARFITTLMKSEESRLYFKSTYVLECALITKFY